jgi:hypothetical protein
MLTGHPQVAFGAHEFFEAEPMRLVALRGREILRGVGDSEKALLSPYTNIDSHYLVGVRVLDVLKLLSGVKGILDVQAPTPEEYFPVLNLPASGAKV